MKSTGTILLGLVVVALVAIALLRGSPPSLESVETTTSAEMVADTESPTQTRMDGSDSEQAANISDYKSAAVLDYLDGFDQRGTQGDYIRYTLTRSCVASYAETVNGEQWPTDDCADTVLSTDHPYGSYTIEQLEYAASEMKDPDAAYLLGLRFSWEPVHQRRSDAHRYFLQAFLSGAPESVFADIIQEQGYSSALRFQNDELDRDHFEASYIMNRVGEHFGAIENRTAFFRKHVGAYDVDFEQLEADAQALYEDLDARRTEL